MRKFLVALAAILGSIHTGHAQVIEINVSYSLASYKPMFEELKRGFEATNPNVKVKYSAPVMNTHEEHLQQVLRGALTGDAPDVSFQGNQFVGLLVSRGLPVALDSFIDAEKNWQAMGYTPSSRLIGSVGNKTFGLAFQTSAPILLYNATLLQRAGVSTEKLPSTWPEVITAAKKVQTLGGGVSGGLFDYTTSGNFLFQSLVMSYGGRMMNTSDTAIAFNGPEGLKSLEVLRGFGEAGQIDMSQAQSLQAFGAGAIGVLATFSSALEGVEKQAAGKFQVKAGAWPIPVAGGRVPAGGRTVMIFTKDEKKQKAAWQYLKYVTGPEGQTTLVKMIGAIPNNRLAIERADLLGAFYKAHPNQRAVLDMLPSFAGWYSFPGENSVKITTVIRDQTRSVVLLQKEPKAALDGMAREVESLLPR